MKKTDSYTKKVMEYFKHPRNYGRIEKADGVGKVGNPVCGDVMWLYIKVAKDKKGNEIIKDIKFETFGCVAAIATSSAITEMAKGKKLSEAIKITREEIVDSLEGLPPVKIHCSVLAASALSEAIYDYFSKTGQKIPKELEEKHKILKKEKEEVKEKHKEWVEIEEKMHKE
jgi:nitrogen fixation NifU-like protein